MTHLPDDIDQLKAMLLELQQQNEAKDKLLAEKQKEVAELTTKVQLLVEQLNLSKSKRFASQSEKIPKGIFNEAEQQNTVSKFESQKKKRGRKPLPEELEREVHKHELNAPYCECCNEPLHQCGVETSEELKIIPQKVSVIRHERTKYACRQCEKTHTESKIVTAPKPASMIPKSLGSADAFAAVVTPNMSMHFLCTAKLISLIAQASILAEQHLPTGVFNWAIKCKSSLMR